MITGTTSVLLKKFSLPNNNRGGFMGQKVHAVKYGKFYYLLNSKTKKKLVGEKYGVLKFSSKEDALSYYEAC